MVTKTVKHIIYQYFSPNFIHCYWCLKKIKDSPSTSAISCHQCSYVNHQSGSSSPNWLLPVSIHCPGLAILFSYLLFPVSRIQDSPFCSHICYYQCLYIVKEFPFCSSVSIRPPELAILFSYSLSALLSNVLSIDRGCCFKEFFDVNREGLLYSINEKCIIAYT